MAEKRVIELEVRDNANDVQKEFESLRKQIAKTTEEIDQLSQAYGENSQEADDARKKLSQLTQAYDKLSQSAVDTGASFEQVYGELQPLTARMGEAEDRLYELALAGKQGTKEYNELLKAVGKYKRTQIETDLVVDAASKTLSNKLMGATNGVASAFSIAEGSATLLGIESAKLQENMLKLQAAMAITSGLTGWREAKKDIVALGKDIAGVFKGIKSGLAATGIGLFLVALGTVVAYWDDIKAAVGGVTAEQEKLNEVSKAKFETSKAELENLDAQDNILKLQGKSEREILNLKIAKVNTAIEDGKINLQNVIKTSKAEEEAAIKNYNLTKKIVDFILDTALFLPKLMLMPIDMAIKGANKVSEALGFGKLIAFDMGKTMEDMQDKFSGFIAGSIFNVEEVKAEGEKTRKELEKEIIGLENQKAGFQNTIKDMDKAANDKAKEDAKARNEIIANANAEAARLAIEQQNELNKRLEDLAEQNFQNTLTDQERELLAVQDKYFELETLAAGNAEALAQIEVAKMNEINDINLKYQNEAYEADKLAKEKKAELDKAAADAELELRKRNRDFAIESAVSMMSTITELAAQSQEKYEALNEAVLDNDKLTDKEKQKLLDENNKKAKKAFDIQKAANVASALITTYQSATAAYASQFTPLPDPTSPIRGAIAAGLAVAAGLANVKRIASQKFEGASLSGGSSSSGGSVPDAGTMQTPNFSVIGSSGVNQLAQLQQQPTKAYVVSGEVTSQQALDRNRVQNATL